MKKSLILLFALSSVAAFGAASDAFESKLTPYNQAVMSGDFYGIFGHHAALREFDKNRAYGVNQQNVTLLKYIIDTKPSDHFLSNTLELFEPNSSVHQIIQAQDWQRLRQEIDNLERPQTATQPQGLTVEQNLHTTSLIPRVPHASLIRRTPRTHIAESDLKKKAAITAVENIKKFAGQITWGPWNIKDTLANRCRLLLTQDPGRVLAELSMLYATGGCSTDGLLLPALCINNALIKRIGMLSNKLPWLASQAAYSPDGNTLALQLMSDNKICLIDTDTGKEIRTITAGLGAIAFGPDNNIFASPSKENAICIWNVSAGDLIIKLPRHIDYVRSLAFSPDGNLLASASYGGVLCLWDVSTGKQIRKLQGHTGSVNSIAFSPDGTILASASADSTVCFWDVSTGIQIQTLKHAYPVHMVAFSPDGNILASASQSTISLWHVTGDKQYYIDKSINVLKRHRAEDVQFSATVLALAFSPDSRTLAAGSSDGAMSLWNINTGDYDDRTVLPARTCVTSIAFNPNGNSLVYTSISMDGEPTLLATQYIQPLLNIINYQEQAFLLNAAQDWLRGQPSSIKSKDTELYKSLIVRFSFLNNPSLFMEDKKPEKSRNCIIS